MKTIHVLLPALMLALSSFIVGCNSPAENVQAAREDVADAKADLDKANKEYRADTTNYKKSVMDKIASNELQLVKLKEKLATETAITKADYNDQINLLEKRNAELKIKIKNYSADGNSNWEVFKAEVSRDMDELGKALNDLTVRNVK